MTYSVAIRTLGTAGEKYILELESLHKQTLKPEKIVVYIAEGYERPEIQVGIEEYVWVHKGMVSQRALQYKEISSDYILLLDDDVVLAPESVEQLIKCAEDNYADCVAADTFRDCGMSLFSKFKAIVTNLVFPRGDDGWAFKINRNGSFSYNSHPQNKFYLTQSFAGPAALWKKEALLGIHYEDELWMENLEYPHGNDFIHSYKLYRNGYKAGVLYGCDIQHLDAAVSSQKFKKSPRRLYFREKGFFTIWYRAIYSSAPSNFEKLLVLCSFLFKLLWLLIVHIAIIIPTRSIKAPYYFVKGAIDGLKFVHSKDFKALPSYIIKK